MSEPLNYVIWSEEHGGWWLPGKMGYTRSLTAAGHYSKSEAFTIVEQANKYLNQRHGLPFHEVAFVDPFYRE